ncbi:MAG: DUF951 domain-containing protein [bacterium]
MEFRDYELGDVVRFRKEHPCGGDTWEIIRIGMDFKAKCTTCGRLIMLPRRKFEKSVKEIVNAKEE